MEITAPVVPRPINAPANVRPSSNATAAAMASALRMALAWIAVLNSKNATADVQPALVRRALNATHPTPVHHHYVTVDVGTPLLNAQIAVRVRNERIASAHVAVTLVLMTVNRRVNVAAFVTLHISPIRLKSRRLSI
jgi:hypothetical protein